jgi:hypothetical protein
VHPHEWSYIAELGGGNLYRLLKSTGAFLDYHNTNPEFRAFVQNWALEQKFGVLETRWRVEWYDSEIDDRRYLFANTESEALEEFDDLSADSTATYGSVEVLCATAALATRVGFLPDPSLALMIATTCWVEDCTTLDGVWWEDTLDPMSLSAPRGVINLKSLPSWSIENLGLLDSRHAEI